MDLYYMDSKARITAIAKAFEYVDIMETASFKFYRLSKSYPYYQQRCPKLGVPSNRPYFTDSITRIHTY